jgi:signal transduction histidine kinase
MAETQAQLRALELTNQRMNEFVGIASHELRTPLTTAVLGIESAQRRIASLMAAGPEAVIHAGDLLQLGELFETAGHEMARQERLVNDLLDLSRLETGRLEMRVQRCDLAEIVRQSVEEQRLAHPTRQITLSLPQEAASISVYADPDRIRQVIANYLTNALKFSAEDRPVRVEVRNDAWLVQVRVTDEGPGLTPVEQQRVWDQFYRAQGVPIQSGSEIGLGLGLYISRQIIERHGGQVGVESEPGHGSTFWLALKLAPT